MHDFSLHRYTSSWVAACISSFDVHIGILTDVLMGMHIYVHASDFLVPVFYNVVIG